ncbi:MAG: 30S ribosomal protein S12 methylthiotransferase RimO [Chloroflexota bacterium]
MPKTFAIVNLGCAKNAVDGEGMGQVLLGAGLTVADPARADLVVVNTCGFIQAATDESVEELVAFAKRKRPGQLLVAAGCLAEKWGEGLRVELPEVDAVLGTRRWPEIAALVAESERGLRPTWTGGDGPEATLPRVRRTAHQASAYVKIADGCSSACAFCVIPLIKGPYRSRSVADVVAEASELAEQGVKELVLVAQDTTAYGRDRGERSGLVRLVEGVLAATPSVPWLRLMYAYPTHLDDDLLRMMAAEPRLVSYLDIPLQHAHPAALRRMRRPAGDPRQLVDHARALVPDLTIRSTFIAGFPGETDEEFDALLGFLEEARLDRVGVFAYSREEGAPAAAMAEQVPEAVKQRRVDEAMRLQRKISLARNRAQVGRVLAVLVEGTAPVEMKGRARRSKREVMVCGRSYRDAPEVDGLVFFPGKANPGEMVKVRISEALPYDLLGERVVG